MKKSGKEKGLESRNVKEAKAGDNFQRREK